MSMEMVTLVLTVVIAHFFALISPGPDFLIIVKSAIRNDKSRAIGVAMGIAAANGIYITLCIIGVGAVLATSLIVMTLMKVAGGLFLLYVAVSAIRSRKSDYTKLGSAEQNDARRITRTFREECLTGFLSGISNPKNIIFYLSLFSVVLTNEVGMAVKIALGVWMTALVFVWDAFIIFVLSRTTVRSVFSRIAFYVDKVSGTLLGVIGIRLLEEAFFDHKKL